MTKPEELKADVDKARLDEKQAKAAWGKALEEAARTAGAWGDSQIRLREAIEAYENAVEEAEKQEEKKP